MKFTVSIFWKEDHEYTGITKVVGLQRALALAIVDLSMGYGDGIETEIVIKKIQVVEWRVVSNEAKRAES